MDNNKIAAIIVSVLLPLSGVVTRCLTVEEAIRTLLVCFFPLVLVLQPRFVRTYFKSDRLPLVFGWLGFAIIFFVQIFIPLIWGR